MITRHLAWLVARDQSSPAVVGQVVECPPNENYEASLKADEVHKMNKKPQEPGKQPVSLQLGKLCDSGGSADDSEVALV